MPSPDALRKLTAFLASSTAADALDGSPVTVTNDAPAFLPLGVTIATFSATDVRGNTAQTQVPVTIISVEAAIDGSIRRPSPLTSTGRTRRCCATACAMRGARSHATA